MKTTMSLSELSAYIQDQRRENNDGEWTSQEEFCLSELVKGKEIDFGKLFADNSKFILSSLRSLADFHELFKTCHDVEDIVTLYLKEFAK